MAKAPSRPPTNYLERARSLLSAMRTNNITVLPDGTTDEYLDKIIQRSMSTDNEIDVMSDALKRKQDERDVDKDEVWKITKGGVAHIESRFGDDAVQLEQVGRKRRSKYAKPARNVTRQTQTVKAPGRQRKSKTNPDGVASVLPESDSATHLQ